MVAAAVNHGECRYLSVDGTFRVCFSLLGQHRFDTPKPLQKDAPSSDTAFHRVISIRGCTGAVLGLMPSLDERSTTLADCICKSLSGPGLEQVVSWTCGNRLSFEEVGWWLVSGPSGALRPVIRSNSRRYAVRAGDGRSQDGWLRFTAKLVAPEKLEWLFNGLRYRHFLPPNVRALYCLLALQRTKLCTLEAMIDSIYRV